MANMLLFIRLCPYLLFAMFGTYRFSPEVEMSIAQSTQNCFAIS